MGFVGKAGPIGAIAMTMVVQLVHKHYTMNICKSFKEGGANDIRKLMDDRDKEMMQK